MTQRWRLPTFLVAAFLIGTAAGRIRAGTVNWSSTFLATNVTSTEAPMDGTFLFQLGAFDAGFTPTAANTASWASHWHAADSTFYNSTTKFFTADYVVATNAAPFGTASRGYIWGFNCSVANGEWVLLSAPNWTWPQAGGQDHPVEWNVSLATEQLIGQINGAGFQMKTARVSAPVPILSPAGWSETLFSAAERSNVTVSGWDSDPDGDGLRNCLEYCLGLNPKSAASTWSPTLGTMSLNSQSYLKLAVPRCAYAAGTVSVQASSDLVNWSADPAEVQTVVDNLDLLEVRDALPVTPGQPRFLRVKGTLP